MRQDIQSRQKQIRKLHENINNYQLSPRSVEQIHKSKQELQHNIQNKFQRSSTNHSYIFPRKFMESCSEDQTEQIEVIDLHQKNQNIRDQISSDTNDFFSRDMSIAEQPETNTPYISQKTILKQCVYTTNNQHSGNSHSRINLRNNNNSNNLKKIKLFKKKNCDNGNLKSKENKPNDCEARMKTQYISSHNYSTFLNSQQKSYYHETINMNNTTYKNKDKSMQFSKHGISLLQHHIEQRNKNNKISSITKSLTKIKRNSFYGAIQALKEQSGNNNMYNNNICKNKKEISNQKENKKSEKYYITNSSNHHQNKNNLSAKDGRKYGKFMSCKSATKFKQNIPNSTIKSKLDFADIGVLRIDKNNAPDYLNSSIAPSFHTLPHGLQSNTLKNSQPTSNLITSTTRVPKTTTYNKSIEQSKYIRLGFSSREKRKGISKLV